MYKMSSKEIISYSQNQKEEEFYKSLDTSCKQAKDIMQGKLDAKTLDELIDELNSKLELEEIS